MLFTIPGAAGIEDHADVRQRQGIAVHIINITALGTLPVLDFGRSGNGLGKRDKKQQQQTNAHGGLL